MFVLILFGVWCLVLVLGCCWFVVCMLWFVCWVIVFGCKFGCFGCWLVGLIDAGILFCLLLGCVVLVVFVVGLGFLCFGGFYVWSCGFV